jgi:hypothetical protein
MRLHRSSVLPFSKTCESPPLPSDSPLSYSHSTSVPLGPHWLGVVPPPQPPLAPSSSSRTRQSSSRSPSAFPSPPSPLRPLPSSPLETRPRRPKLPRKPHSAFAIAFRPSNDARRAQSCTSGLQSTFASAVSSISAFFRPLRRGEKQGMGLCRVVSMEEEVFGERS